MDIINLFNAAATLARTTQQSRELLYKELGGISFPLWFASDVLRLPNDKVQPLLDAMVNEGLLEVRTGTLQSVYRFKRPA